MRILFFLLLCSSLSAQNIDSMRLAEYANGQAAHQRVLALDQQISPDPVIPQIVQPYVPISPRYQTSLDDVIQEMRWQVGMNNLRSYRQFRPMRVNPVVRLPTLQIWSMPVMDYQTTSIHIYRE